MTHDQPTPNPRDWNAFRETVPFDQNLVNSLSEMIDWPNFVAAVLRAGAERGYAFSATDVEAALHAGRRAWLERWI
jgi:hypothetical protein